MSNLPELIRDSVDRHARVDVDPARLLAGAQRRARTHRRRTYAAAASGLLAAGIGIVVALPNLTLDDTRNGMVPATNATPARPAAPMATPVTRALDEEALGIDFREYERLTRFAESRPSWFAGAWYTQKGTLMLGIKAGAPLAERRLVEDLPDHGSFTLTEVAYSLAELWAAQSRIDITTTLPPGLAGNITSIGINIPANRVGVGLVKADLAARQALYDVLGPMAIADEIAVAALQPGPFHPSRYTAP